MKYHYEATDTYALAQVSGYKSKVFASWITFDVHYKQTLKQQAITALYKELLLSGCGDMDRTAFLDKVNSLGGTIDIHIEEGAMSILLKSTEVNASKLISLAEIMLTEPQFKTSELKRSKTLIGNQLKEDEEDARTLAHEHLQNALFAPVDRRHNHAPSSIRGALTSISRKDINQFHKLVRTQFITTSMVGSAAPKKALTEALERISNKHLQKDIARVHAPQKPRTHLVLHNVPSKQNIEFSIGGPIPLTMHHPDYVPLVFGINVLGKWGGFAGRLMSTVREQEGLTYGIYARPETVTGTETGYWRIMTFFSPSQAEQGLSSTIREIKTIHEKGITKNEYERFKTILNTQISLLDDSPTRALDLLHQFHTAGFTIEDMETYKSKFQSISRAEVNKVLKQYLNPAQIVIAGSGPIESVKKVLEAKYKNGIL